MKLLNQGDMIKQGSFFYEFALANPASLPYNACSQSRDDAIKHKNEDSLYLDCEDFWTLSPYLDIIFVDYPYYGPKKIHVQEWNDLKAVCTLGEEGSLLFSSFFKEVDEWLLHKNNGCDYFWILGV